MSNRETEQKFSELLNVMAQLRSHSGCPWDKEQTHLSLKPCLLEETYELLDALDDGDAQKVKEELGDVLLQVVFHSQIASEENRFTIKDVIEILTDKLVRRHPYVFAGEPLPEDPAAALKQRAQLKANEKFDGECKSALGNMPKAMPALARAQSISWRAASLGFEWPHIVFLEFHAVGARERCVHLARHGRGIGRRLVRQEGRDLPYQLTEPLWVGLRVTQPCEFMGN